MTILRDGAKVGTFAASELTPRSFIMHMSGLGKVGNFADVNFDVFPGEIVGLTGLLGSGRTELALSLCDLNPADAGRVEIDGQPARLDTVASLFSGVRSRHVLFSAYLYTQSTRVK